MTRSVTEREFGLVDAFIRTGKEFGYSHVDVSFAPFREFKVKWMRSNDWASFKVSDYLTDASDEVYQGLARTLFQRLHGDACTPYDSAMRAYVTDDAFPRQWRDLYIRRTKTITGVKGIYHDLSGCIDRLVDSNLIPSGRDIKVFWSDAPEPPAKAGSCSVLMRTITLHKIMLDSDTVDQDVIDFVVYTQALRIIRGLEIFGQRDRQSFFLEDEKKFPGFNRIVKQITGMGLYI